MKKHFDYDEFENKITEGIKTTPLYRLPELNYTCNVTDKNGEEISASEAFAQFYYYNYYEEISSRKILLSNSSLKNEDSFNIKSIHERLDKNGNDKITYSEQSNRNEENIAKRLFQIGTINTKNYSRLVVSDYQVPVNRVANSSEGKVDLVFTDDSNVIIGELKDEDSKETLLRAAVEIKTYQYKIQDNPTARERFWNCYGPKNVKYQEWIQPAVIMFEDERSQVWKDFVNVKASTSTFLHHLLLRWDILFFVVRSDNNKENKPYKDRNYSLERVML